MQGKFLFKSFFRSVKFKSGSSQMVEGQSQIISEIYRCSRCAKFLYKNQRVVSEPIHSSTGYHWKEKEIKSLRCRHSHERPEHLEVLERMFQYMPKQEFCHCWRPFFKIWPNILHNLAIYSLYFPIVFSIVKICS